MRSSVKRKVDEKIHREINEDAFATARGILGKSFISPIEVRQRTGYEYMGSHIATLRELVPPVQDLVRIKNEGAVLVALPPEPISLIELRTRHPNLFQTGLNGWGSAHRFANHERTPFGWFVIEQAPSTHAGRMVMPMARKQMSSIIAAWFFAVTWMGTKPDEAWSGYMLTSSVDNNNNHVYVAPHPERGQICLCCRVPQEVLVRGHQFYTPS